MLRGSGFSSGCGATLRFRAGDQGDHPYANRLETITHSMYLLAFYRRKKTQKFRVRGSGLRLQDCERKLRSC